MTDPTPSSDLSAAENSLRTADLKHDIIVLPHEFNSSNVALYDDSVLDLVKVLRADGIDASFAHEQAARSWIGKKSAELLIAFIVGIASNAGWAGLCALLRRRNRTEKMDAKIARITQTEDAVTWQWIELHGTGEEIASILEQQQYKAIESNDNKKEE